MLDLQALEQKVSEVLSKETPETLTAWLAAKRAAESAQPPVKPGEIIRKRFSIDQIGRIRLYVKSQTRLRQAQA